MDLKSVIRTVPDFPKSGVFYRDITPLLENPQAFRAALDAMERMCATLEFKSFAATESRGFIFAAPLADRMGKRLILVRKNGKLPCATVQREYTLEYGTATLEMHTDAVTPGERVIIVDDLIATGGSIGATVSMVQELGGTVLKAVCLIELPALNGRAHIGNCPIESVLSY